MKLIAFVGPKGSGKDTCALIAQEAGIVAGKISFAGPLKRICSDVFDIPLEVFEHPVKKEEEGYYLLAMDTIHGIVDGMEKYIPHNKGDVLWNFYRHVGMALRSPRQVLQYVGTEVIRAYEPSWHCRAAFSPYNLSQLGVNTFATYAVTDCRFMNEWEFLSREHETKFHYVERPEAEARLAQATHRSELEIRNVRQHISSTIPNAGSLEDFRGHVVGGYL